MNLNIVLLSCFASLLTMVLSQTTGQTQVSGQFQTTSGQLQSASGQLSTQTHQVSTSTSSTDLPQVMVNVTTTSGSFSASTTSAAISGTTTTEATTSGQTTKTGNVNRILNTKEEAVNEQSDKKDESSLLDLRISVLKKTKINKIKNQASHIANAGNGGLPAVGGLPDVGGLTSGLTGALGAGLPDVGSLTGAVGGLTGALGGLGRRKRDTQSVKKILSQANNVASGLTNALPSGAINSLTNGISGIPAVGGVANSLAKQEKVVDNVQEEITELLEIDLNGKPILEIPIPT